MSETVKLYRAVCEAEFRQLMATGRFQSSPGSLEGKWFAESYLAAQAWGQWFSVVSGVAHEHIIGAEVDREAAEGFIRHANLDGCGPARFAELQQLNGAVIREARAE